ncbi:hypothetical protein CHUAL_011982 [Chamberlinius hualienensis]
MADNGLESTEKTAETASETTETIEPGVNSSPPVTSGNTGTLKKEVKQKVDILLKATGDAPIMKQRKWTVELDRPVGSITVFMKKYLKMDPHESLFLYINQAFAPSPDQLIRNLYECFGTDGKLVLHYCKSQAWG